MKVKVVIPFRDRGLDPRRRANLDVVMGWWYGHGFDPVVQSDGLSGTAQFNRHRAYNLAVSRNPDTQVFVFTEADMLIHPIQINQGVRWAKEKMGLVVPFTQYRYLSEAVTNHVRGTYSDMPAKDLAEWWAMPPKNTLSVFGMRAESTMDNGRSIGAVNIVSRRTLNLTGGFTEATEGNWYDDNIIEEGFAFLSGNKTRWVGGPAVHLYHLPGHKGDHLTDEDKAATAHNKRLLNKVRRDIRNGDYGAVKSVMEVRSA